MKKLILVASAFVLTFAISSCGGATEESTESKSTETHSTETAQPAAKQAPEEKSGVDVNINLDEININEKDKK